MKNLNVVANAVNAINALPSDQKDVLIAMMNHLNDGGSVSVLYVFIEEDDEGAHYQSSYAKEEEGIQYSMVSYATDVCGDKDWFVGKLSDEDQERINEIKRGWVMYPTFANSLAGILTSDNENGVMVVDRRLLATVMDCMELDVLPSNPRQAAALGLDSTLFI